MSAPTITFGDAVETDTLATILHPLDGGWAVNVNGRPTEIVVSVDPDGLLLASHADTDGGTNVSSDDGFLIPWIDIDTIVIH